MFFYIIRWLCRSAQKSTYVWLSFALLFSLVSVYFLLDLRLDTNLVRLLPPKSPITKWTNVLRESVGDGGYFTIVVESDDRKTLIQAINYLYEETNNLPGVHFTSYKYPIQFIEKYKYLLLPLSTLEQLYDYVIRLEAESNPFTTDLLSEEEIFDPRKTVRKKNDALEETLKQFVSSTEYHESDDGTIASVIIYPKSMINEVDLMRKLYDQLEDISRDVTKKYKVWSGVGGSQIKNLREYRSIVNDFGRASVISLVAIFAVLFFCFRSLRIIPILTIPLLVGLAWAFAFVPTFIGPLNIVTVFLLLILFGLGIDYSIHLVRKFQSRLLLEPIQQALFHTFYNTGKSIIVSALTTAFPLFILGFSNFRGFSDFGLIGGMSIIMVLIAMFTVMPPLLLVGCRFNCITSDAYLRGYIRPPRRWIAFLALCCIFISFIFSATSGKLFDYNFSSNTRGLQDAVDFEERHSQVYKRSMTPAALYLAPDMDALVKSQEVLKNVMSQEGSTIERLTSITDFAPSEEGFNSRLDVVLEVKEILKGGWYKRIKDKKIIKVLEDFKLWQPPAKPTTLDSLPPEILSYYMARDGSGRFLLGIYPSISRRNGEDVLRFHDELKSLGLPEHMQGPVGEVVIFSEILTIVLKEAPVFILLALFAVALPIYLSNYSLKDTALILFPLLSGLCLLLGVMQISGMQLNYLSVVIIPALIGMGVDDGVHYFRYCKAHNYDVEESQKELFGTLSVSTLTTMIGYSGLVMAHNRGLQSLGVLACLGMACLWVTSVFLFPPFLNRSDKNMCVRKIKCQGDHR